jgi:alpha-N-arabinofuranosidase
VNVISSAQRSAGLFRTTTQRSLRFFSANLRILPPAGTVNYQNCRRGEPCPKVRLNARRGFSAPGGEESNGPDRRRPARPLSSWSKARRVLCALVAPALAAVVLSFGPPANGAVPPAADQAARVPEIVVKPGAHGLISKYLFGTNLLWADNAEGAFDPATGSFYPGFVSALRRLGITALRYPGGTTSDSFDWLRAIGPRARRQPNEPYGMQAARLSKACCVLDGPRPSDVGPNEFGRLLDDIGATGTVTVNFATGTTREAADFVAYMTAPLSKDPSSSPAEPSYWAALRARDGHPAPYDVPYWEVGNEQYFRGQYGWRSGQLVSIGPHAGPCPPELAPNCLYAFGGTTAFSSQSVGTFADQLPSASYSTGAPGQKLYVYFPPVVPDSAIVYVGGQPWSQIAHMSAAGPEAEVYTFNPAAGAIAFGDGAHGEIPPAGAKITVSYESGPHGGFVEFYRAMKAMGPKIHVCESEGTDAVFLQVMGRRYPYDCVGLHEYARPKDTGAPLLDYEKGLLSFPPSEGATLARLQGEIRRFSGRDVPVVITEYGQLVAPVPETDPQFNLSLDEGLFIGAQLIEWIGHKVPLAEKYLTASAVGPAPITTAVKVGDPSPLALRRTDAAMVRSGLSVNNAIITHDGPVFVAEPAGQVIGLMSRLGGLRLISATTLNDPVLYEAGKARVLWVVAGATATGRVDLVVVNAGPVAPVTATVVLDGRTGTGQLQACVLDGPSPTAYNTAAVPDEVSTRCTTAHVGKRMFNWRFPAHSVTLLRTLTGNRDMLVAHLAHGRLPRPASATARLSAGVEKQGPNPKGRHPNGGYFAGVGGLLPPAPLLRVGR